MEQKELDKIIKSHEKQIVGNHEGKRADLSNVDLNAVNSRGIYSVNTNLNGTKLRDANLGWAKWHETRGSKVYKAHLNSSQ